MPKSNYQQEWNRTVGSGSISIAALMPLQYQNTYSNNDVTPLLNYGVTTTANITNIQLFNSWINPTAITTANYTTNVNFPIYINVGQMTDVICEEIFEYDVDGHNIELPREVLRDENDEKWLSWINEVADEADRRQRARELHNQELQKRERKRALIEAERIASEHRARTILFEHLDEEQQRSWETNQVFYADINGTRWKFASGTHGNVYTMHGDLPVERFCIAPVAPHNGGRLPIDDVILAQLLLVRADEAEFRRIANITRLRPANFQGIPAAA